MNKELEYRYYGPDKYTDLESELICACGGYSQIETLEKSAYHGLSFTRLFQPIFLVLIYLHQMWSLFPTDRKKNLRTTRGIRYLHCKTLYLDLALP